MATKDPSEIRIWRLASVRINPASEAPELYCLVLEGEKDRPLTHNGRIVFFRSASESRAVLQKYGTALLGDEMDLDEPFFVCDIATALYVLSCQEVDSTASILGVVNLLLDLVPATSIPMPQAYHRILSEAADHFTFDSSVIALFSGDEASKAELINAILWCIGAVGVMSDILPLTSDALRKP